jgi:hypothetical protein
MTYREVAQLIGWSLVTLQNVPYTITIAIVTTGSVVTAVIFGDTMNGLYASLSWLCVTPIAVAIAPKVARLFRY